jgi:NADPH:quinone reductase-like Zn-dependent oxidoreductase
MKAIVLDAPGPPQDLKICDRPIPDVRPGWIRIRIRAFGINRSELMTRLGLSRGVTFPRVLGIECAGEIDAAPGSSMAAGQKVVAMMGGMGRAFDGGYAEYAVVPASIVIPISTELPWEIVGALPEMLQTAYGSLTTGLDLQSGQTLLIRGGTTSIGTMAAALARDIPSGVRLTAYGGEARDLPQQVLQRTLDRIAAGDFPMPPYRAYQFDEVQRAHADMEQNRGIGKIVVRTPQVV